LFGLGQPLTNRDAQAATFTALFQETPRTDTPEKLPVAEQPQQGLAVAAGIPVEPGDEPLTSLQQEMLEGFIAMTSAPILAAVTGAAPAAAAVSPALPSTQGDAAAFVESQLSAIFPA